MPDCWIYVQDTNVKLGRIQVFNNWSPYLVKDPEHTVWIGLEYFCEEGDSFWNMSDEECIKMAIGELETMGVIAKNAVLDSHREKIKKAYPAYFDTYEHMDKLIEHLPKSILRRQKRSTPLQQYGSFNADSHKSRTGYKAGQNRQKGHLECKHRKGVSRGKGRKLIYLCL